MTRRNARQRALQFLFQSDFNTQETDQAIALFWKDSKEPEQTRLFAERLVRGVLDNKSLLDGKIRDFAANWNINRMGAVDRNVIRIALYEMFFCPDIPPVVSINEAVSIAKRFGSDESGRFVNGILDRARTELSRPDRIPAPDVSPL
jgi:transcription antitermination protein NusB